ncbi:MAG: hypothetical protein IGR93_21130 [Hydrococcus sp. C42_A2020_068]|uniref:hypothetical protein n=1 Tax=Pleurocapsa sp. PCC 7327 TaxID=118163 RepID=UPI00029F889A|nr:hypothetical protein [Pleurocapsa sp. PCC 7327]AFY78061.1 hypothetical protein Ple7327_2797 [Pleurocapsa sp. PCC 7327]MBF2022519.1 hypothetical protein [Hydrococcus sp. C42_A2020_068]
MGKLVILQIGDGNFEAGFPVIVQIGEEGKQSDRNFHGKLPHHPELLQCYRDWQDAYYNTPTIRNAGIRNPRLEIPPQITNHSEQDFKKAAQTIENEMKAWLDTPEIRELRDNVLDAIRPEETARIIIATQNRDLWKLPWHLWDLFKRRPNSEPTFSTASYANPNLS